MTTKNISIPRSRRQSPCCYAVDPVKRDQRDRQRSIEMIKIIQAKNGECFRNALLGTLMSDNEDLYYVEGFAIFNMLVIEHGWIETGDGTVIDPTPSWIESPACYYPAIRSSAADARRLLGKSLPVAIPEYQHAYWRAQIRAYRDVCGTIQANGLFRALLNKYPELGE